MVGYGRLTAPVDLPLLHARAEVEHVDKQAARAQALASAAVEEEEANENRGEGESQVWTARGRLRKPRAELTFCALMDRELGCTVQIFASGALMVSGALALEVIEAAAAKVVAWR
jgi:hypothetical protein